MGKPLASKKEYAELGGTYCPYCGSGDIEGGEMDFEGQCRRVKCNDCNKLWNEIFKLLGYEEIGE